MIPKSLCIALTFHMSLFLQFQLPAGCRCPGSAIIAGPHVQMEFNSSPQISLLPQFFFLIKWATVTLILLENVLEKLGVLPLLPLVSLSIKFFWSHLFLYHRTFQIVTSLHSPRTPYYWLQSQYTNPDPEPWPIPQNAIHITPIGGCLFLGIRRLNILVFSPQPSCHVLIPSCPSNCTFQHLFFKKKRVPSKEQGSFWILQRNSWFNHTGMCTLHSVLCGPLNLWKALLLSSWLSKPYLSSGTHWMSAQYSEVSAHHLYSLFIASIHLDFKSPLSYTSSN